LPLRSRAAFARPRRPRDPFPGEEDVGDTTDARFTVVTVDLIADGADGRADAQGGLEQRQRLQRSASRTIGVLDAVPPTRRTHMHAQELTRLPIEHACRTSPSVGRLVGLTPPNRVRSLRTGQPPSVAPHPVSRRAVTVWFQAGEPMPGEDLHLPGWGGGDWRRWRRAGAPDSSAPPRHALNVTVESRKSANPNSLDEAPCKEIAERDCRRSR